MMLAKAEQGGALLRVEEARALLAECMRVDEAKDIRDKAEAIAIYLREQKASREAQNDAAEIKLRAERRLGELLKEQKEDGQRQAAHRPKESSPTTLSRPTLADLGISRDHSSHWQQVARVPDAAFESYIAQQRADDEGEITSAGARRLVKKAAKGSHPAGPELPAEFANRNKVPSLVRRALEPAEELARRWPAAVDLKPFETLVRDFLYRLEEMQRVKDRASLQRRPEAVKL